MGKGDAAGKSSRVPALASFGISLIKATDLRYLSRIDV